jgi:glucose-6-phosphate 1-epimerase
MFFRTDPTPTWSVPMENEGDVMIEEKRLANGFEYIEISNNKASAKIALQGAHLFHYQRNGDDQPLIWLSKKSFFEKGKAIRGGIPVCWPWFGQHASDPMLPQHGFARTSMWELHETVDDPSSTTVSFILKDSVETLKLWPYRFQVVMSFTISDTLVISLSTTNVDEKSFEITSALHTYFDISDIEKIAIEGFDGASYYDKINEKERIQQGDIVFSAETDRIYSDASDSIVLQDAYRRVVLTPKGSSSTIIWNPWAETCASMKDMEDDGYKSMVCIENGNVMGDRKVIMPNKTHTLGVALLLE